MGCACLLVLVASLTCAIIILDTDSSVMRCKTELLAIAVRSDFDPAYMVSAGRDKEIVDCLERLVTIQQLKRAGLFFADWHDLHPTYETALFNCLGILGSTKGDLVKMSQADLAIRDIAKLMETRGYTDGFPSALPQECLHALHRRMNGRPNSSDNTKRAHQ